MTNAYPWLWITLIAIIFFFLANASYEQTLVSRRPILQRLRHDTIGSTKRLAAYTQKNSSDVMGRRVAHARHRWAMAQCGNMGGTVKMTNPSARARLPGNLHAFM